MPILARLGNPTFARRFETPDEIRGMQVFWHGGNGVTWDIGNDPASPAHLMAGARGFHFPAVDRYRNDAAGVDGAQRRGMRTPPRKVYMPVQLLSPVRSQDWYDFESEFLDSLSPDLEGRLEVVQPNGVARSLRLVLEDFGDTVVNTDPALVGWINHYPYMQADQPYWEGPRVDLDFAPGVTGSFTGPNRTVSSSFTLARARVRNVGNVDVWPMFEATGPSTSVSIGINGHTVTYPGTITPDDRLVLNSDPSQQTAYLNGVNVTGMLTSRDWAPIPVPGKGAEDVPLAISLTGGGSVRVSYTPLYWRAW